MTNDDGTAAADGSSVLADDGPPLKLLWLARHAERDQPVPRLAETLRSWGHEVQVVGWAQAEAGQRPLMTGVRASRGGHERREPIRLHLPSPGLFSLLTGTSADVVIHRDLGPLAAAVGMVRARRRSLRSVALLEHRLEPAGPAATVWWKQAPRRLCGTSPTIALANHPAAAAELERLGVEPDRIHTGWWLAGFDHLHSSDKAETTDSMISLVVVGALTKRKGVDLLIEALADALGGPAAEESGVGALNLTVVGDGPERSALQRLASERGVADRVAFIGPLAHDRLPAELTKHHLLVMGSYEDHTGRSAIEAMSCGVPVLASSRSGIPEILVTDGVDGLVADPTDRVALAEVLRSLTPERLESLAAGARAKAPMLGTGPAAAAVLRAARAAVAHGRPGGSLRSAIPGKFAP